jgi:predicted Rdx family selenoprotein
VSLAAALESRGFEASATPGAKSQFDVLRDGQLVFSKQSTGHFPELDEVLDKLR